MTPRGPALQIDGIGGHVSVPHAPILMPRTWTTVIIRTRNPVNPAQHDMILVQANDGSWHQGHGLCYNSATVVRFCVTRYEDFFASVTVNPLEDSMIVGIYDGSVVRIFANGMEGTPMNSSGGILLSLGPLEFGRGWNENFNINGLIH